MSHTHLTSKPVSPTSVEPNPDESCSPDEQTSQTNPTQRASPHLWSPTIDEPRSLMSRLVLSMTTLESNPDEPCSFHEQASQMNPAHMMSRPFPNSYDESICARVSNLPTSPTRAFMLELGHTYRLNESSAARDLVTSPL
jgi:hypothetical protein